MGLNQGCLGGKAATNRLSYGTASASCVTFRSHIPFSQMRHSQPNDGDTDITAVKEMCQYNNFGKLNVTSFLMFTVETDLFCFSEPDIYPRVHWTVNKENVLHVCWRNNEDTRSQVRYSE
jgi:hypothetical protein